MKRFLRKVGLLTAAVIMMSSGVALADNAQPNHGWMREVPNATLSNASEMRATNRLKRHQTLYWTIANVSGDLKVIDTSLAPPATATCTLNTDCASAPLFIAADSSVMCVDSDIASTGDGDTIFTMRICSDSTCSEITSIAGDSMDATAVGSCTEFGTGAGVFDGWNTGGSWVYIEAITTGPGSNGETTLVWIVGK